MAHTFYRRADQVVDVRRLGNGGAAICVLRGSRRLGEVEVPPRLVNQWLERGPGFVDRACRADLATLLQRLRPKPEAKVRPERTIERLVLSIPDLELSGLPWECWLDELWIQSCPTARRPVFVRASPVRFPLAETPLTLPLRFLEVTTRRRRAPAEDLAAMVQSVFGGHDPARVARAVRIESTTLKELAGFELPAPRLPLGVVHLWEPRFPADAAGLMRTTTPKAPGSLGWVLQWTRELRCRLIVCVCRDAGAAVQARRLGAAVVARGGPAVLVLPGEPEQSSVLARFFSFLIHNHPLDHAVELARDHPQTASLFVGGGREEALRLTRLGDELSGLAADLIAKPLSAMAGDPRIRRL